MAQGLAPHREGALVNVDCTSGDRQLVASHVLLAVGRRPYTEGLGLEKVGVVQDDRKHVSVDHQFQTNVKGIYAIGDAIAGPMLAHKAEEEGVVCAEIMAGQSSFLNRLTRVNLF